MQTHRALTAAAVAAVFLTGCGGSSSEVAADPAGSPTVSPSPSSEPSEDPGPVGIEHPTGADDVIARIETGGGFVPVEYAFTAQPSLLLTGDGRLLQPPTAGKQTRLVPMTVAQLSEEQVQTFLGLAAGVGLLATPPDYADDGGPQIADAPTTTVTLTAAGGTWRHEAYALGFNEGNDARLALSGFIDAATAAVADVEVAAFVPEDVALFVQPTDLEREVVAWPSSEVDLASASGCLVAPAEGLVETLSTTSLLATFSQDGALYSVSAAQVLPGDEPCTS